MNKNEYEEWRIIAEFPNYEISNNGRVRNIKTGHIKAYRISSKGYYEYKLCKNGKYYFRNLHIMLARAFMKNPNHYQCVNHIDGNKLNCDLNNLEWCTSSYNSHHAHINGLVKRHGEKKVYQFKKDGTFINVYESASMAAKELGLSRGNICSVCRKIPKYKTAGGYIWRYASEVNDGK